MENTSKLSWVALRGEVARRAGVNDKVAKQFLDAFVAELTRALEAHDSVRINGLGTFNVKETARRKSVDVRSGEEITIPSYHKLSFTSDASLKKGIGFENPAVTPDSDPMRRLSEQADEIVGILAGMGQHAYEQHETQEETQEETQNEKTEEPVSEITTVPVKEESEVETFPSEEYSKAIENMSMPSEETQTEEENTTIEEEQVEAQPIEEPEPVQVPVVPVPIATTQETSATTQESSITSPSSSYSYTYIPPTEPKQEENKKPKTWLVTGIVLAVVCVLLVAAYFVLQYKYADKLNALIAKTEAEQVLEEEEQPNDTSDWEEIKLAHAGDQEIQEPLPEETEEQAEKTTPIKEQPSVKESVLTAPRSYKELITTVEIHKGSRLTLLAQQYYGHKELWVFIYEANLGRIKSPTNIKEGTQIRIPKLNEQLTDLNNPDTKELIQQLNRQYLR